MERLAQIAQKLRPADLEPARIAGALDRAVQLVVGEARDIVEVERVGGIVRAADVGRRPVGGRAQVAQGVLPVRPATVAPPSAMAK